MVPPYGALMESYDKAQRVQRDGRETKLERMDAAQAQATIKAGKRGIQPVGMSK